MDQNAKRLWIDALRSGNYNQGKGSLKARGEDNQMEYCCLGVLCEVALANGAELSADSDEYGLTFYFDDQSEYLPESVITWAGLTINDPYIPSDFDSRTLSMINDDGASFGEIADLIEENL